MQRKDSQFSGAQNESDEAWLILMQAAAAQDSRGLGFGESIFHYFAHLSWRTQMFYILIGCFQLSSVLWSVNQSLFPQRIGCDLRDMRS